jgi:hypothetical protein
VKNKKDIFFYFITISIVVILYLIFQPKLSSRFFGMRRTFLWNNFLNETIQKKKINSQSFWELREFYCPGHFVFDKGASLLPFLRYDCDLLKSEDSLTNLNNLSGYVNLKEIDPDDILFNTKNEIIYKNKKNSWVVIMFLKSIEEMKTANGYFDYNEKDKELVENKYWLNATRISEKL